MTGRAGETAALGIRQIAGLFICWRCGAALTDCACDSPTAAEVRTDSGDGLLVTLREAA